VLLVWGHFEAMRVPRVKHVDVTIPRLGAGMDGLRVAIITDTHYGPVDRAGWSAAMVERVNELDADVVCHLGDIADGTADVREAQAAPLARVRATHARVYVTGNHEYFSQAEGWLNFMQGIGWETLRNRHVVVERGGDALVIAGVDDVTARGSGLEGHGADVGAALVAHPQVHTIAFTGSMPVGVEISRAAAEVRPGQRHLKRVVSELGGKNCVIVDSDADLDEAVPGIVSSAFVYAGQKCSAAARVLVHEAIADQLIERVAGAVRVLVVGQADALGTDVPPVIERSAKERVDRYAVLAAEQGRIAARVEDGKRTPRAIGCPHVRYDGILQRLQTVGRD